MTYEEFKALAMNPAQYAGQSIFRVDTFCYYDEWVEAEEPSSMMLKHSSFHLSLKDAESALSGIKSDVTSDKSKIYCHFIYELPVGVDMRLDRYVSVRVYDDSGNLTEQSVCSHNPYQDDPNTDIFRGRSQEMTTHKLGDFVEIFEMWAESQPTVKTAIITDVPYSIEKCYEIYKQLPEGFYLNWHDEKYSIVDCPRHERRDIYEHPIYIFKPRFPISESRKKELREYAQDDCLLTKAYWREDGSATDLIVARVAGIDRRYHGGFVLTPEDFLPVYGAAEMFDASVSVNCSITNPLDALTDKLLELRPDIFDHFTHFIINFIDTDIPDKRVGVKRIKWLKALKQKYPNLAKPGHVKYGSLDCRDSDKYHVEIIAYK